MAVGPAVREVSLESRPRDQDYVPFLVAVIADYRGVHFFLFLFKIRDECWGCA